jgi:hypothetical protein
LRRHDGHEDDQPQRSQKITKIRKNTFDLRRASALQNLEALHRSKLDSRTAAQ